MSCWLLTFDSCTEDKNSLDSNDNNDINMFLEVTLLYQKKTIKQINKLWKDKVNINFLILVHTYDYIRYFSNYGTVILTYSEKYLSKKLQMAYNYIKNSTILPDQCLEFNDVIIVTSIYQLINKSSNSTLRYLKVTEKKVTGRIWRFYHSRSQFIRRYAGPF